MLASDFAQRMLPQIFRAGDPVLEVALPPEKRQELEAILEGLPREVFIADDSLGWVYQFWQADQKDAVNASENKIGADELPAVTQLFTEDYMVLFLLHNTLGAWWAGKVLAAKPDLARMGASEDALRAACAVQGIEWSYLRFVREGDVWRPAAGTFPGWPTAAKDLSVLDPCMGSGHFLAFALPMLMALRREEEKVSLAEAVDAVLHDNLFGLELDPRCTQIAAFNVGLTAWKLAGYRPLPALNLACAGLALTVSRETWLALMRQAPRLEVGMARLHELFVQAPVLGSLINPRVGGGTLLDAHFGELEPYLEQALAQERGDDSAHELAVVAAGIARAARLLSREFTLVVTNVPYLGHGKQEAVLKKHCAHWFPDSKADVATCMLERCVQFLSPGGTTALVSPQSWLFIGPYKKLRARLLRDTTFNFVIHVGPRGFQTISGEIVNVNLVSLTRAAPTNDASFAGVDASELDNLAAPNGEGRRILDKLTHTYLGDWLDRQRADQRAGVEGADGRVAAAEHLKHELEKILEGESPYDLFVRWKPLHQQPVGWEPDIDDGVRVNIRPFMTAKPLNARGKNACILRVSPKIKWDKDRGKEPTREKADFPWFWGWDESTQDFAGGKEFDGNRWNDLHYTRAAKLAARERVKRGR